MSNDINDIIKQHVDIHESEIDPQEIWEGILNKQKPKRRILFFLLPICLIGVIGLTVLLLDTSPVDQQQTELLSKETSIISGAITKTSNEPQSQKETERTTVEKAIIDNNQSENANKLNSKKTQIDVTLTENFAIVNKETLSLRPQTIGNNHNLFQTSNEESTFSPNSTVQEGQKLFEKLGAKSSIFKVAIDPEELLILPLLPFNDSKLHYERRLNFNSKVIFPIIPSLIHKKQLGLKAIAMAGIVSNELSEERSEAYTASLLMEYSSCNKFSVSTGLSVERLYEKFKWNGDYIINSEGETIGLAAQDDQGNAVVNFSSAQYDEEYYEIVNREIDIYNNYDFIDLPISLAYQMNLGKLRASLTAGISVNLMTRISGKSLGENLVPEELSLDKVGAKHNIGLEWMFPISNKFAVLGSINYGRRSLTIRTTKNTISYYQGGIGLGINL